MFVHRWSDCVRQSGFFSSVFFFLHLYILILVVFSLWRGDRGRTSANADELGHIGFGLSADVRSAPLQMPTRVPVVVAPPGTRAAASVKFKVSFISVCSYTEHAVTSERTPVARFTRYECTRDFCFLRRQIQRV